MRYEPCGNQPVWQRWLRRAVRNRHCHAIEPTIQHDGAVNLISAQVTTVAGPVDVRV